MGWAPLAGVKKGEPTNVSIGGANIGIAETGAHQELAVEAAIGMTGPKWQSARGHPRRQPPVMNAAYDDPEVRKEYPFADILREQLKDSVVRPATPSYSDVTLAIQSALHPPAGINPQKAITTLA